MASGQAPAVYGTRREHRLSRRAFHASLQAESQVLKCSVGGSLTRPRKEERCESH